MSEHVATVQWVATDAPFTYESFSRAHALGTSAGEVRASATPEYHGDEDRTNPEELLVGALASCHMLTFLSIAARKRLVVVRYSDRAVGTLAKNDEGRLAVTDVVLAPRVEFAGIETLPGEQLAKMHELAHKNCFIANSVRCRVRIDLG